MATISSLCCQAVQIVFDVVAGFVHGSVSVISAYATFEKQLFVKVAIHLCRASC